jgi:hypothetical protein
MILTKRQLIKMALKEAFRSEKIINKVTNKIMHMPEKEFIEFVDTELHWRLEAVRKNQYLVG